MEIQVIATILHANWCKIIRSIYAYELSSRRYAKLGLL